jgi:NADPH:quinone reductase-like Zn-dependent oxidoreductase
LPLLGDTELRAPILSVTYKRAQIIGIGVGHRRAQKDMVRAINRLGLKPVIDAVFLFEQAPEVFRRLKQGPFGKVVIHVGGEKDHPVDR